MSGPDPLYVFYETDTTKTYVWDGATWVQISGSGAPGAGDVAGPVSSTDKAIARWNGTGGYTLQDSTPTVEDDGTIANLTDPVNVTDAATKGYVDTAIAAVNVGGAAQSSFLVSGGQVVWDSAYTFTVSAAEYYINGVLHSSAEDTVTLGAAHASLNRIDVIAVDDTGAVVVVPGTPSAQPSEPDLDPGTQLKLSLVLVEAATAAPPDVVTTVLYADNAGGPTEWNWTSSDASLNVNSTTNPRTGTKDIEGTAVVAGAYVQGQIGSGTFDPNSAGLLVLYLRSKAAWTNKRGLQVTLRAAGVTTGSAVTIERLGTFGFDSTVTSGYQQVAIPTALFAVPTGTTITQVRVADFGGAIGFYLDDLSFQGGAVTQPVTGITQEQADARYRALSVPLALASSSDITGDLPLANLAPSVAASKLLGRGSASGAGDWEAITLGSNLTMTGSTLSAASTPAGAGVKVVGITIDGGGSAITTGVKGYVRVNFSGTLTKWTILSIDGTGPATSGAIVIDVWKDVFASYPPTVADTITASAKPTLSGARAAESSTLTGWSTAVTSGDVFGFTVDSATTVTRVCLELEVAL